MSMGGDSGSSIDTTASKEGFSRTSAAVEGIARENWDFAKTFFNTNIAPRLAQFNADSSQARTRNSQTYGVQTKAANARESLYRGDGEEAIKNYFKEVEGFDSTGNSQAALAMGDVANQSQNAQESLNRDLSARGVNPNSGSAVSAVARMRSADALTRAAQANRAREAAIKTGLAVKGDAANLGANLGNAALNARLQQADTLGRGQAIGATQLKGTLDAGQFKNPAASLSANAYGQQSGTYAQMQTSQEAAKAKAESEEASGWGELAGVVIGTAGKVALSDRRLKTNIVKLYEHVPGINIYAFDYVWGGPRQIGVMADEVEKVMPEAVLVIGGYKAVDYAMVGVS